MAIAEDSDRRPGCPPAGAAGDAVAAVELSLGDVDPVALLGPADANLRELERHFRSRVAVRAGVVRFAGPAGERAALEELFRRLVRRCQDGEVIVPDLVRAEAEEIAGRQEAGRPDRDAPGASVIKTPRKTIIPRTPNQQAYVRAIGRGEIIFAIGPAGTGKTYLAVATAVEALVGGRCHRIVLTRPAVEAGESLGYLPGTFKDKVDPYLRPLYDALFDMLPLERARRLLEEEVIEVAALAFMRGRTLSDSYIILDEAQNTTATQMRMFLTRLGWHSRAIVTGDITQIDLEHPGGSGLVDAQRRLAGVEGIEMCSFDASDVVRPPLVSRIVRAYEERGGRA
ncbi:MAG: PhoH family protein [bacterium]